MEALPHFPLFPDAFREGVFEDSADACGVCRKVRGLIYACSHYGESPARELKVCPWCIADGSAGKLGISFNDGTIYPFFEHTPQLMAEDRDLVEHRTPGFTTWQNLGWQMCCGRACIYLGEADSQDLVGRWASAVPAMLRGEEWPPEEIDQIVKKITRGGSPCGYVFQCSMCGRLSGDWDCD